MADIKVKELLPLLQENHPDRTDLIAPLSNMNPEYVVFTEWPENSEYGADDASTD